MHRQFCSFLLALLCALALAPQALQAGPIGPHVPQTDEINSIVTWVAVARADGSVENQAVIARQYLKEARSAGAPGSGGAHRSLALKAWFFALDYARHVYAAPSARKSSLTRKADRLADEAGMELGLPREYVENWVAESMQLLARFD